MKILVTGGRHYNNQEMVFYTLENFLGQNFELLIHGGATGADTHAANFATEHNIPQIVCKPDWSLGLHAGPLRNQQMLDEHKPDLVIAFPGGRGTFDMTKRSKRANIPILYIKDQNDGQFQIYYQ